MKIIKKAVKVVQIKYRPDANWIDVNFGDVVFHYFNNKMMIDETPYEDEKLLNIENLEIKDDKYFIFNSFFKGQDTRFEIDCTSYVGAINLAYLIKNINERGITLKKDEDEIEILFDEDGVQMSIGQKSIKRFLLFNNKFKKTFTLRFPEPSKKYSLGSCRLSNGIIYIHCNGTDQYDTDDSIKNPIYEWNINLTSTIKNTCEHLINIGFK